MTKYRKKPVVVDAWRYESDKKLAPEWACKDALNYLDLGEWIVKEPDMYCQCVRDDIFRETYEPVEE